jgi:DHA1 family inner membrane transport protein
LYLALFCLLLGAFAIGTTEFLVAGLLPAIAVDLGVSIPRAGLLVTGYALAVAFGGPVLAVLVARWARKPAIVGVLLLFVLAHGLCALAPSFGLLMAGRALAGIAHGCFFGLAIVLATASVPTDRRGMALSVVVGGINIANVIGVPAGTAVGEAYGWRAAFAMVGVIALAAAAAIAAFVPGAGGTARARPRLADQVAALMNRTVLTGYGIIVLHMIAVFGTMTFVAPWLTEVMGIASGQVPLVMLAFGICGTLGIVVAGRVVDRHPDPSLVLTYPVAALSFGVAWLWTPSVPVAFAALGVAWGVGSISAIAVQTRVIAGASGAPELASTLLSSIFNIGIAIGAALTARLLAAGMSLETLPLVGFIALAGASVLAAAALLTGRRLRR